MDTYELIDCLSSLSNFVGVFALDEIKNIRLNRHNCIIVNMDLSTEEGSHWIAINFSKNGLLYYFDSYGFRPYKQEIWNFLSKHSRQFKWNRKLLQSLTSDVCGIYCAVFCLFMNCDLEVKVFLTYFSEHLELNDCTVTMLFRKHIKCPVSSKRGQSCKAWKVVWSKR